MNERILVVDDTPANIQTVAAILKGRGYQLSVATNGKQALEVMEKILPDLVLLDVMMPELDGFETCQRIKATEAWKDIPVIFLTAKGGGEALAEGFESGAVMYINKPFTANKLLTIVNTMLESGTNLA
jgi:CheY-like chemotaxis protein